MGFRGGAGALNRIITVQALPDPSGPKNDFGELISEPSDLFDCRAAFEPLGGHEFPEAQKRHAETTARFRIRYRRDLSPQDAMATRRILYVEDRESSPMVVRKYDIKAVEVIDRVEMRIEVSEVR